MKFEMRDILLVYLVKPFRYRNNKNNSHNDLMLPFNAWIKNEISTHATNSIQLWSRTESYSSYNYSNCASSLFSSDNVGFQIFRVSYFLKLLCERPGQLRTRKKSISQEIKEIVAIFKIFDQ